MNKLREKILKIMFYDVCKDEMDEIMELIEEHSSEAFYAGRDEYHTGCGDYEYSYDGWTEWYKEESEK